MFGYGPSASDALPKRSRVSAINGNSTLRPGPKWSRFGGTVRFELSRNGWLSRSIPVFSRPGRGQCRALAVQSAGHQEPNVDRGLDARTLQRRARPFAGMNDVGEIAAQGYARVACKLDEDAAAIKRIGVTNDDALFDHVVDVTERGRRRHAGRDAKTGNIYALLGNFGAKQVEKNIPGWFSK